MIREWVEARLTSASPDARRLGYVDEVVSIGARARRHAAAWAPHLAATRGFVDRTATGGEHLVVLGSGRLLDLPLESLAARYRWVTLVDWVHPRGARRRAARLPGVSCLEADVTGCLGELGRGRPLPVASRPTVLEYLPPPTTTVSLNLVSQLPILPSQCLERWGVPFVDRVAFARALIVAHLRWLAALPGRAVLITDVTRQLVADDGGVEDIDALLGLALPSADASWSWSVAPRGELERGLAMTLAVQAWGSWGDAARTWGGDGPPGD